MSFDKKPSIEVQFELNTIITKSIIDFEMVIRQNQELRQFCKKSDGDTLVSEIEDPFHNILICTTNIFEDIIKQLIKMGYKIEKDSMKYLRIIVHHAVNMPDRVYLYCYYLENALQTYKKILTESKDPDLIYETTSEILNRINRDLYKIMRMSVRKVRQKYAEF